MAWPSTGSYTAWSKCFKVTSQASKITAVNSWYWLDLALMPSSFWSAVQADGDDIRTTQDDMETAVDHKLIFIDTSAHQGLLAIAQPHGSAGASSDIDSYVFAGNSGASSAGSTSVFPSNLEALYMLQEAPTSSAAVLDWSGNARHSTAIQGSMTSGDLTTDGPFAGLKCVDFDSNDRVNVPSTIFDDCETANAYTFSAWFKPSNDVSDYGIFGTAGSQFAVAFKTATWYTIEAISRRSDNAAFFTAIGSSDVIAVNVWAKIDVVYNGSTLKVYVDGSQIASVTATSLRSAALSFYIGMDNTTYARGKIAQVSMISAALSADQIATLYANEKDAGFWVVSEVSGGGGGGNGSWFFMG